MSELAKNMLDMIASKDAIIAKQADRLKRAAELLRELRPVGYGSIQLDAFLEEIEG